MYLVRDRRGYFYLCESARKGGRVVRRKLAYLGRFEIPYHTGESNAGTLRQYDRATDARRRIIKGTAKADIEFVSLWAEVVARIDPGDARDAKTIARAKKVRGFFFPWNRAEM